MSIIDAFSVRTQRILDAMGVEFQHRVLNGQVACDWPGPCLICRWWSPAFLASLEAAA